MFVAASPVAGILTDLFVVLLAAKLGDELFKRLNQPSIVGEILAGVLIGPSVIGLVEPGETLEVFAELGVVFLLFWVGLETKLSELAEVGRAAILVGMLGFVLPLRVESGSAWASESRQLRASSSERRWWRRASVSPRRS